MLSKWQELNLLLVLEIGLTGGEAINGVIGSTVVGESIIGVSGDVVHSVG